MTQQIPKTSVDSLVDNIAYASDMLADMSNQIIAIKRNLPPMEAMRDVAFSADYPAIFAQNNVMADTTTLVWSLENAKTLLSMICSEIIQSD